LNRRSACRPQGRARWVSRYSKLAPSSPPGFLPWRAPSQLLALWRNVLCRACLGALAKCHWQPMLRCRLTRSASTLLLPNQTVHLLSVAEKPARLRTQNALAKRPRDSFFLRELKPYWRAYCRRRSERNRHEGRHVLRPCLSYPPRRPKWFGPGAFACSLDAGHRNSGFGTASLDGPCCPGSW